MQYTNKFNLPQAYVNAIKNDGYNKGEATDFSITELIDSPRISQLNQRHKQNIVIDVSDMFNIFLGHCVHGVLDANSPYDSIIEHRWITTILDCIISGKVDSLDLKEDGSYNLNDYKVTSVWSSMLNDGPKDEWYNQLRAYKGLISFAQPEINITSGSITSIYKDWKQGDAATKNGYPECPINIIPVDLPHYIQCQAYLLNRVAVHKAARSIADNDSLPRCTSAEKWERPGKFAVHQKLSNGSGIKQKAYRLHDTMESAMEMVNNSNGEMAMVHRPAIRTRCESWCNVKDVCNQYKEESI